jgi:PhoH-like ATPase
MKTYILDTNVALIDANCLYKFKNNKVIIPLSVIRELDTFKVNLDLLGKNARNFCKTVDEVSAVYNSIVDLEIGSTKVTVDEIDTGVADDDIITLGKKYGGSVVVSNDTQVRLKARANNIEAQEYKAVEEKDLDDLYDGLIYKTVSSEIIDKAFNDKYLDINTIRITEYYPNQQVILTDENNESKKFIGIIKNDKIIKSKNLDAKPSGIKTRNLEQRLAVNLMLDEDIKCTTLSGTHGSSKSFLSLACALQLYDDKKCDRILIIRSPIAISKDLYSGFVKGSQSEKLLANMGAIASNLEAMKEHKSRLTGMDLLESYVEQKIIELVDVSRILGSSFSNKVILIDEAQSFTPSEMRAIVSRCGENSRIFITSDLKQQSMNKLLPEATGVFQFINAMMPSKLTAHITMKNIYRSEFVEDLAKYWN